MKNFTKSLSIVISLLAISFTGFSQTADHHHEHKGAHGQEIDQFYLPLEFGADSLIGFDDQAALEQAQINFDEEWQRKRFVAVLKRNYIDHKYNLRQEPPPPQTQAPCTNPDFELGNISGWTAAQGPNNNSQTQAGCCPNTTTQIVTVGAGNDPNIGAALPQVPPGGGNWACRLGPTGASSGGTSYRISQQFNVTAANSVFIYKYAVVLNKAPHSCTEQPFFNIRFEDCNNNPIPCGAYNVTAIGSGCSSGDPSFITSGVWAYKPWTTRSFDLTAYIGQCVNIEFTVAGCVASQGAHGGYAYVDASCQPMTLNLNGTDIPVGQTTTNFCSIATNTLCAPPGFTSYTWNGPGGATGQTSQCINSSTAGTYSVTLGMAGSSCTSPVLYSTFNIVPKPLADFSFTTTPCQSTFTVPFTNSSTLNGGPAITNVWWDFDNNGVPDNTSPSTSYTFPASGTFPVEIKVSNGGCTDSITKMVTVTPRPTASFNVTNACLNTPTNFTSTSTPTTGIASYVWTFGDNTPNGSGPNPTHTYTTAGTYTVKLVVTNTDLCKDSITQQVTISPNPVIAFASSSVCLNSPTTFTNSSTVTAPATFTAWAWDFDNNGITDNTTQNPTNTFATAGTHTIELKGITNNGCRDSALITVNVNALPTATFTPVNACLNANVALNNTSSVAPPASLTLYSWNFGAGATPASSSNPNPPSLAYNTAGPHVITLTVTANTSCTASISQTVQITPQPVANFSTTSVCQSTATAFTDLSTPTGSISNWAWDFDNNGTADNTTQNPSFTFTTSGTFTVSLIVSTGGGCKDTVALPVNVWGHAIPNFTPDKVCFGSPTTFSNTTNTTTNANVGGVPTYDWGFGDGGTATNTPGPTHTYTTGATGATFNVTLTATTTNGCVDNTVKTVTVNALPTATFTPVNACMNNNVVLNNTSNIPGPDAISSYTWVFGAAGTPTASNLQNPNLTYNASGVQVITLGITANTSCTASITQTVDIYPQPVANFSTTSVCQSTATAYTDLSTTTVGTITGWQWDYVNDGSIDNNITQNPTNTFPTSGTFTTMLIATSSNGCKDTVRLPVDVWGHTVPDFSPDKVCFGAATTFTNLTNTTANPNVGGTPSYSWNFADNGTSTLTDPVHSYTLGGNANAVYNVTLTVTSSHNCKDSVTKTVNVYAVPTASFTSDSVCLGSASHLFDASNGNGNTVNTFEWDFSSDGTVDITGVANPNFVFPNFGNNPVTYTVSTSPVVGLVCKNITNTLTVWVHPNPNPDFTFVNKCINAQPNTFDANTSSIAIGTNTNYAWAYGDAGTGTGITSSHTYAAAGVYNVTLTVTSNKGCQKAIVKQTEVFQKPFMNIVNSPACDKKAMTFTATTQPNSGNVVAWFWDFNSSITSIESTGQTTTYTFPAPGAQTVALVSETDKGCRDTLLKPLYVDYVPVPQFSVNKPAGCPVHCVTFTDLTPAITGPGVNANWQWVFGDGTAVNANSGANQAHCYNNTTSNQLALYDVKLVVTTDKGCTDSITKTSFITVYPTPIANYDVSPNPGNIVTPLIYFTNQSQDYTKWWWNYGDNPSLRDSVSVNPAHFYSSETAQTYQSFLIVANQYGCRDTAYVKVEIGPEFTFYIPNAFTPANSDGINDVFTGKGIGIEKYEMWIFDRWGEMIYYTDDITKGWDGRRQGKSQEVQQDVYVWKVKLKDVLGKKHDYVGHVTLLR